MASSSRPARPRHRVALLLGPPAYAAAAAVYFSESGGRTWLGLGVALAFALLALRRRVEPVVTSASLDAAGAATRARFVSEVAVVIAVSTASLHTNRAWIAVAADVASLLAALALLDAVRRAPSAGGLALLASRSARPSADNIVVGAAGLVAVAAAIPLSLHAGSIVGAPWADPSSARAASAAGAGAMLFFVGSAALLARRARQLELGIAPRLTGAAACAGVGLVASLMFAGIAGPAHAARVALAISSYAGVRLALAADAVRTEALGRRVVALTAFAGPVVVLAALAIDEAGTGAPATVAIACALTALIGLAAPRLEEPFLPAGGAYLEAFRRARVEAFERDVAEALGHALVTLRGAAGHEGPSAELWTTAPARVMTVDAAGYLRERDGEVPTSVIDAAAEEPEATLRADVLAAVDVRKPELRPQLRWLEARDAMCAVLVAHGREAAGVLVVPRGQRTDPMTIEEAHALKRLADTLISACEGRSARTRSLAREVDLRRRIEGLEDELIRIKHRAALDTGRARLESERLARPATTGIYAASSRLAYEALERRVASGAPLALVAPSGVDPVAYVARAHLAGPRADGPLVVVDGTASREHDVTRWTEAETSPLALADGGLLLLVDGASLPRDVQLVIARALSERRTPWARGEPLDVIAGLSANATPAELAEQGRLAPELAVRFEGVEPVRLPRLRERPEDLRAIVADRIAREGLRAYGAPTGLDAGAFALLADLPFDGEDAELTSLARRLVARSRGATVVREHVRAVLEGEPEDTDELSDRRRRSSTGP